MSELDKTQVTAPPRSNGALRQHEFDDSNKCEHCGATREAIDDNIVHKYCHTAEREAEKSAGEHAQRIGTVYMRTKTPLTPEGRALYMRELARRIELNVLSGQPWPWKIIDGTTLMIEIE